MKHSKDQTKQNQTKQNQTKQNQTKQDQTKQDQTKQDQTKQERRKTQEITDSVLAKQPCCGQYDRSEGIYHAADCENGLVKLTFKRA